MDQKIRWKVEEVNHLQVQLSIIFRACYRNTIRDSTVFRRRYQEIGSPIEEFVRQACLDRRLPMRFSRQAVHHLLPLGAKS